MTADFAYSLIQRVFELIRGFAIEHFISFELFILVFLGFFGLHLFLLKKIVRCTYEKRTKFYMMLHVTASNFIQRNKWIVCFMCIKRVCLFRISPHLKLYSVRVAIIMFEILNSSPNLTRTPSRSIIWNCNNVWSTTFINQITRTHIRLTHID